MTSIDRFLGLARFALLVVPFHLIAGCSDSKTAANRTRPVPLVLVSSAESRDVPVTINAPIDLRPLAVVDVGAKTLGYLAAVLVERGDRVKHGQLLATVRPSDLPDQLAAERAALGQAQATAGLARSNHERARQLSPSGLLSLQELQQTSSALAAAEAAEAASKARIEALAVRLGETRILSPIDGDVISRKLDPGALVGPGGSGAIVTVAQSAVLRVFVSVNEREATRVRLGQTAFVKLDAFPDRRFEGKVVRISPAFDTATRTLDAEVQLPNPTGELRIGMYGRAEIVLEVRNNAVIAPVSAVIINAVGRQVFVVDRDVVRRRVVETGVDGGDWLEITKGVVAGEELVVAGVESLSDGAKVRVSRSQPGAVPNAPDREKPVVSQPAKSEQRATPN